LPEDLERPQSSSSRHMQCQFPEHSDDTSLSEHQLRWRSGAKYGAHPVRPNPRLQRTPSAPLSRQPLGAARRAFPYVIVFALALESVVSCGADLSEREYRGHYRWGFEVSEFRPCGSSEKWWATGDPASLRRVHDTPAPGPVQELFVVWYGKPSAKGAHGHLGAYSREFKVARLVEARLPKTGDCP
jgi:hypothetical protein